MSRFARREKPPKGFEYLEPTLTALQEELREKVNEPHEGMRKGESLYPVHQINWQRSRYIYDMFYVYKKISRQVYDYCLRQKLVDAPLVAKWKKPGYERLCSTYVINTKNYKFGTVSICRVPKHHLGPDTVVEDPNTGCLGCASGAGGNKNIFGNKYGQYLAAIQIAREKRQLEQEEAGGEGEAAAAAATANAADDSDEEPDREGVWAQDAEEAKLGPEGGTAKEGADAEKEALKAAKRVQKGGGLEAGGGKRQKT
ncbi:unnamed protein product [Chrysoparadoxa australica]